MKIRVITIHNIPNFGSVFQCYALCHFLKSKGYSDVEVMDYNPSYFKTKSLRTMIAKMVNLRAYIRRNAKFTSFIRKWIPITEKNYSTIEDLAKDDMEADVFVAGGDQLWNVYHPSGRDEAYRLIWTDGKKISYGTSMGQAKFPEDELEKLASHIESFANVGVRESSSVRLLAQHGIKAHHCVDPVFLLEKSEYTKFVKTINEPRYLLVYLVTPSDLLEKCIKFLKEKYGLKVILCSGFSKKCSCDLFLKDLGPDEILSYIHNAEIVLSSSFHATSFSMLFEKQFFTILPGEHTNERIEDILAMMNASDRIIKENDNIELKLSQKINYPLYTDYDIYIEKSKEYLMKAISENE